MDKPDSVVLLEQALVMRISYEATALEWQDWENRAESFLRGWLERDTA